MPVAASRGFDLYYERAGEGPNLLFLTGSGTTVEQTRIVVKPFADSFDVVAFDYRGMGRSGSPSGPYRMADCAADAVAVLDELGWPRPRVVGVSFGGMVAQELAVTVPERVERLALLCTSAGGPGGSSYPLHELEGLAAAERLGTLRGLIDTRFDDRWLSDHPGDRLLLEALQGRTSGLDDLHRRAAAAQLEARRTHDVWDRLPAVTCPTLVACGRYDGIAPPQNGTAIAEQIAGSRLWEYEGGHAFFVQDPRALPEIVEFLAEPLSPG
jgi:3-oxoadipate enol-lactonase